jgi:hypothetical protein
MISLDVKELGKALLERAKDDAGEAWESVEEEVTGAAKRFAELTARGLAGEDVESDLRHASARLLNWSWVGADRVRAGWAVILEELAVKAGKILAHVGRGILGV